MCIMYGCRTAREITLFARYCLVTPRQKPPKVGQGVLAVVAEVWRQLLWRRLLRLWRRLWRLRLLLWRQL